MLNVTLFTFPVIRSEPTWGHGDSFLKSNNNVTTSSPWSSSSLTIISLVKVWFANCTVADNLLPACVPKTDSLTLTFLHLSLFLSLSLSFGFESTTACASTTCDDMGLLEVIL